jgi:hypothetical protein
MYAPASTCSDLLQLVELIADNKTKTANYCFYRPFCEWESVISFVRGCQPDLYVENTM